MASLPQRIMAEIRKMFEDRWTRRPLILLLIILSAVPPATLGLGLEATAVILLVIVLLYLEALESVTLRVDDQLSNPSIIPWHDRNERISERIDENNPDTIHLLDYSANYAQEIFENETNAEIYLLIKSPQSAINRKQSADQIQTTLRNDLKSYIDGIPTNRVHVRLYMQQGSIRGRRIGERHLILSWYTRKFESAGDAPPPDSETLFEAVLDRGGDEKQELWGHKNPMVEFTRGDDGYEVVDEEFFQDVYRNLWETGMTPYEQYEYERQHFDQETYTDERPIYEQLPLAEWVMDETGTPIDDREQFLKQIGDDQTEAAELFD